MRTGWTIENLKELAERHTRSSVEDALQARVRLDELIESIEKFWPPYADHTSKDVLELLVNIRDGKDE